MLMSRRLSASSSTLWTMRMKRLSLCSLAVDRTMYAGRRHSGRMISFQWQSTAAATKSTTPSSSEPKPSSNMSPTTAAAAAVATISVLLTIGAATGVLPLPSSAKEAVKKLGLSTNDEKPSAAATVDDILQRDDKSNRKNKRNYSSSVPPPNSFVQNPDFWDTRVKQHTEKQQQSGNSTSFWKEGLLYDDPSQDEPSSCELCKLFRHGPCRPYQRAVEHCLAQQPQQQQADHQTISNPTEACQSQLDRLFQECLVHHTGLYRLIDNYLFQDQIDAHEWHERTKTLNHSTTEQPMNTETLQQAETQLSPRTAWFQHVHVDWTHWKEFVKEQGWTLRQVQDMLFQQQDVMLDHAQDALGIVFGPSWWKDRPIALVHIMEQVLEPREADFSRLETLLLQKEKQSSSSEPTGVTTTTTTNTTALPYWQYLQDDPDPILIPLSVTCPNVDPETNFPLLAAYVRDDATGRILGHVTAPSPTAPATEATNDNGQPPATAKTTKEEATSHEGDAANVSIENEPPVSNQLVLPFHIVPGWTESIRVYGVYQSNDNTAVTSNDDDENNQDNLAIVFRESPSLSLVEDALSAYRQLEHDPPRLAERFKLIRNYLEWTAATTTTASSSDQSHDAINDDDDEKK